MKTAEQIAADTFRTISDFPLNPTGTDLRIIMARAIEADRAQRFTVPATTRDVEVRIDNLDRDQEPGKPWAAALFVDGEHTGSAGLGTTPQAAAVDLFSEYDWSEEMA